MQSLGSRVGILVSSVFFLLTPSKGVSTRGLPHATSRSICKEKKRLEKSTKQMEKERDGSGDFNETGSCDPLYWNWWLVQCWKSKPLAFIVSALASSCPPNASVKMLNAWHLQTEERIWAPWNKKPTDLPVLLDTLRTKDTVPNGAWLGRALGSEDIKSLDSGREDRLKYFEKQIVELKKSLKQNVEKIEKQPLRLWVFFFFFGMVLLDSGCKFVFGWCVLILTFFFEMVLLDRDCCLFGSVLADFDASLLGDSWFSMPQVVWRWKAAAHLAI